MAAFVTILLLSNVIGAGKVAVITGAASGIGLATTEALLDQGAVALERADLRYANGFALKWREPAHSLPPGSALPRKTA